jgi:crossover junction endodeoxyribonuclease RuvC
VTAIATTRNLILGCDPGFSGGIAIYDFTNKKLVDVFPIPVLEEKGKKEINSLRLAGLIDKYANEIRLCVIEEVGVMTGKEGRQGMFRFGVGVGIVKGILASHMVPTFSVRPSVWKSLENLTRDKDDSLKKAKKLFPEMADRFSRKKDDGLAEAAILSQFGTRFLSIYV